MTKDEAEILALAAEHRLILPGHVAALRKITDADAQRRLGELAHRGLARHHRTHHGQAGHHQITSQGLDAIDSPLPEPRSETIRDYRHDAALPYLTLAARDGRFGEILGAVTERVMRHHDAARRGGHPSAFGSPLDNMD